MAFSSMPLARAGKGLKVFFFIRTAAYCVFVYNILIIKSQKIFCLLNCNQGQILKSTSFLIFRFSFTIERNNDVIFP